MMEEILYKDIFLDKDLLQFSPDYVSRTLFYRMQLRSEMVRDMHSHGAGSNWQRKNITKTKSCQALKKEVVNLQTYYKRANLQNQCMLKDSHYVANKKNGRLNENNRNSNELSKDEQDLIMDEIDFCINNSLEDNEALILENDSDFKINKKDFIKKYKSKNYTCDKTNKARTQGNDNKYIMDINKTEDSEQIKGSEIDILIQNEISDSIIQSNQYKTDLQSLLIMMTINSNINEEPESLTLNNKNIKAGFSGASQQDSHKILQDKINENELGHLLTINSIEKEKLRRKQYVIYKYYRKWKTFAINKREHRISQKRQETLDQFFEKLSKKKSNCNTIPESVQKAKSLARDYSTYQHRYKVQKHIIALQKAKLEEQNKLIDQLKYNNIVEASQQSLDTMKEDIQKTYYEIDKHLRPKIKCLTNELKIKDFEEPSLVLHCLKVPQFLQRMEARAREREEKHAMIRERRKQMEEERIRLKLQVELAKAEMDKEEKMKRIKELREKRKREKIENIRKKQHTERLRALIVMAELHYERNLMAKYGIHPLRRLIKLKRDNIEKAKAHYNFQLIKNIFFHWMWYTEDMWFERNYKAENFYRMKLLGRTFDSLKKNHWDFVLKKQVAEDYYDLYVTQLVFRKFREGIEVVKREFEIKWNQSVIYHNSNILFKTFTCWRSLPALNALQREQEARKLRWREKVLLVVPDYMPPED